jgi:hypothetical protein
MLIIKILFWIEVVGAIFRLYWVCQDHPRQQKDVNMGTDLAGWIITSGLAVWLWFFIWGGLAPAR